MAFKIGFSAGNDEQTATEQVFTPPRPPQPHRSLVEVYFPQRKVTYSYYNDAFDLRCGDRVYVDGKLAGIQGRVMQVNYDFKIKLSAYRKVIAVVDTEVHGRFFQAESHFVTFDSQALPYERALGWFKAPDREEETVSGSDGETFDLQDLTGMKISAAAAEKGNDCYLENRVRYLSLQGERGHAIVEGSEIYEVEFTYRGGQIGGLTCSCFCAGRCKHEFAAMLQLRETLALVDKHYGAEYHRSGYLAAVTKGTLFSFAVEGKETGSFTL